MQEIEIRFPLLNAEELKKKLYKIASLDKADNRQSDIYYNPPHRSFLDEDTIIEWFRLRKSSKGSSITYKYYYKNTSKLGDHCDEVESRIEDIEEVAEILKKLNFTKLVEVNKSRSTWVYNDVEIAVDSVEGLGDFIELEIKGDFDDTDVIKKKLHETATRIGAKLGEQDNRGYPYLLLIKQGKVKAKVK